MKFRPINDDHAIELVSFSVLINRMVDASDLQALIANHDPIRVDLPAVQISDPPNPTVEFSYQLPNGEAAWVLRVGNGNEVAVECRHYTRWQKVWPKAYGLVQHALAVLDRDDHEPLEIGNLTLSVTDRFACAENADRSDLLQPSELIAEIAFQRAEGVLAPLFHSNVGWFEVVDGARVLNTLNIQGRYDQRFNPESVQTARMPFVVIEHQQQVRHTEGVRRQEALENSEHGIDKLMRKLHLRNKRVLDRVLVGEMKEQIGLRVQE